MAELENNDIIYPPIEEHVSEERRNCLVISYDLETTGLSFDDEIVQIGAIVYHPTSRQWYEFSQYILPATKLINTDSSAKIGLEIRSEHLYDTRAYKILPTVSESEGLLLFLNWMACLQNGYDGVVLVSHGSIFLDIPVLIRAINRSAIAPQFFQVVKGFCDSHAIFQEDGTKRYQHYSLQYLYQTIVGTRREVHRAEDDAKDLYVLLCRHFAVESLSLAIPDLNRYTYTPNCMQKYVLWKQYLDGSMRDLGIMVRNWKNQGERKKNIILKNLVAAGYNLQTIKDEYNNAPSSKAFNNILRARIHHMRKNYESYLSDTRGVHVNEIAGAVIRYFKSSNVVPQCS